MSWLDKVKGKGAQQKQQVQQNNQQQTQMQQGQGGQQSQATNWDNFWAPAEGGSNKPSLMRQPFQVDATKIRDVARQQNFGMQIPDDVMQRILGGDSQALSQLLNNFGQAMYARTVHDTMGVVNSGFDQFSGSVEGYLPNALGEYGMKQSLQSNFEQAKDPMFAAHFESVANQFKSKNPNATDDQVISAVKEYFTKMGVDFDAKMAETQSQEQQGGQAEQDWGAFGGFEAASNQQGDNSQGGFANQAQGGQPVSTGAAPVSF